MFLKRVMSGSARMYTGSQCDNGNWSTVDWSLIIEWCPVRLTCPSSTNARQQPSSTVHSHCHHVTQSDVPISCSISSSSSLLLLLLLLLGSTDCSVDSRWWWWWWWWWWRRCVSSQTASLNRLLSTHTDTQTHTYTHTHTHTDRQTDRQQ